MVVQSKIILFVSLFLVLGSASAQNLDLGFQVHDPLINQQKMERTNILQFLAESAHSDRDLTWRGFEGENTQSQATAWLESLSSSRSVWLKDQMARTLQSRSPQLAAFRQMITAANQKEAVIAAKKLSSGAEVQLVDRGIDRPTEVVIKEQSGTKVLFSTKDLDQTIWHNVHSFVISPNESSVAILVSRNGSIDNYFVYVVNMLGELRQPPFEISFTDLAWKAENHLLYDSPHNSYIYSATEDLDLQTGETKVTLDGSFFYAPPWVGEMMDAGAEGQPPYLLVKNNLTGAQFRADPNMTSGIFKYFGADDEYLYAYNCCESGRTSWGQIWRFPTKDGSKGEKFISTQGWIVSSYYYRAGYILMVKRFGADQILGVYDRSGQLLKEVAIPQNSRVLDVDWQSNETVGQLLNIKLQSAAQPGQFVTWDLSNPKGLDGAEALMSVTEDGLSLVSEIVTYPSFDGEKIPVRLIYKKGLPKDGARPVYLNTYGGFNIVNSIFDPRYDAILVEFIRRGGIVVGTAVRGGGELGPEWYKKAVGVNKIVTMKDLIAVAQNMLSVGWTRREMIASTGTSNGGFVVASAAQLSPESFGFIIPIGGVHDQLRFLELDRWGAGWAYDFGDYSEKKNVPFMIAHSPLEQAPKSAVRPHFLITAGFLDTRVNSVHSMKLQAVLNQQAPGTSELMLVDHAGHWPHSILLQDAIGIETGAEIWSRMFEHFHMQL